MYRIVYRYGLMVVSQPTGIAYLAYSSSTSISGLWNHLTIFKIRSKYSRD